MTLTSLNYDRCTYQHDLTQSVGPGQYWSQTPMPHCRECFSNDPRLRQAKSGGAKCADRPLVDVDSELLGITRRASSCPFEKYIPGGGPHCRTTSKPATCRDEVLVSEDTRLSNPPCSLRGRSNGFNRWEWLCQNPQAKVEVPFDVKIDSRILAKDNHRPHVPTPLDQTAALPDEKHSDAELTALPFRCNTPMNNLPMTHWRKCAEIRQY